MTFFSKCALLVVAVPFVALASDATAQTHSVRGRVEDSLTRQPISGATVSIDSIASVRTDQRGEYRFATVPAGAHRLLVRAIGYSESGITFVLSADTVLDVALDIDPIVLDSIRATARQVRVRGRIVDGGDSRSVPDATILASGGRMTSSGLDGRFNFSRVPSGLPFEVRIFAFPYAATGVVITPQNDTTIDFVVREDTMIARLMVEQIRRLDQRKEDLAGEVTVVTREELLRHSRGALPLRETLAEALRYKAASGAIGRILCLVVDELPMALTDGGDIIDAYVPERIERVELYDGMMRVYTRSFMQRLVTQPVELENPSYAPVPRGFRGNNAAAQAACR